MEQEKITGIRYILTLGKIQVVDVNKGVLGQRVKVMFPGSVSATFEAPANADVKVGDVLTLYTEVLTNAHADKPQIERTSEAPTTRQ